MENLTGWLKKTVFAAYNTVNVYTYQGVVESFEAESNPFYFAEYPLHFVGYQLYFVGCRHYFLGYRHYFVGYLRKADAERRGPVPI